MEKSRRKISIRIKIEINEIEKPTLGWGGGTWWWENGDNCIRTTIKKMIKKTSTLTYQKMAY